MSIIRISETLKHVFWHSLPHGWEARRSDNWIQQVHKKWLLTLSEMVSDQVRDYLWPAQGCLLTLSGIVADLLRSHQRHLQRESCWRRGNTSPKWSQSPCLSDFPMVRCFFITSPETSPKTPPYFYRPTTYALLRRWERLRVGASAGMASPPTHRSSTPINSNHSSTPITYHPSSTTQMVGCLVRCLVRCLTNTSPFKTRCGKGFPAILVRCRDLSAKNRIVAHGENCRV